MNKLIFLLTILFSISVNAQEKFTISGRVLDESDLALGYASFAVQNEADQKVIKGGITDSLGMFAVNGLITGKYLLKISIVGYHEEILQVNVEKDTSLQIILQSADNQLEGVTVTANRNQPIIQKADRIVMNVANSVLAAGNNVYDLLKMAPAVSVSVDGIEVQGKGNVLVMLNGKNLPGASIKDLLESIPADQIDRIEVITNPSVKYDAQATSVIEIFTKNATNVDSWGGNVSLNAAQGRMFSSGGNLGLFVNKNKLSFNFSGGYANNGHLEVGGFDRLVYNADEEVGRVQLDKDLSGNIKTLNLSSQLGYQFTEKQGVSLDFSLMNTDVGVDGQMDSRLIQYEPEMDTYSPIDMGLGIKTNFNSINLLYDYKLDDFGSFLDVSANYTHYVNMQNQSFFPAQNIEDQILNTIEANYNILTGMVNYRKGFSDKSALELGLKFTKTRNNSLENVQTAASTMPVSSPLGYDENIFSLYANYNLTFTDYLKLQLGVRAENTSYGVRDGRDSSYLNFFPKVRLDFTVSPQYSTALYYTSSVTRPNYDLLVPYTRYFDTYSGQEGNPELTPEYSNIVGWSHRFKSYSLSLEYAHIRDAISSQITYDVDNLFYMSQVVNFSKRELLGLNLSIPFKVGKFWQSFNTIGIYRQMINIPDPLTQQNVSAVNTYPNLKTNNIFTLGKDWDMDLSAFYRGGTLVGMNWSEELSNVSLGVRKQFFARKGFVKLDVSDVFLGQVQRWGSDFVPVRFTATSRNDTRRIRLTIGYKFGKTLSNDKKDSSGTNAEERSRLGI